MMEDIITLIGTMLNGAGQLITFACTTFPINLSVAVGVVGCIVAVVRKGKKVAR